MTQYLKDCWNRYVKESADIYTDNYIHKSADRTDHYRQGYWDFSYFILQPVIKLGVMPDDTVLEIGAGLGRLIIPASHFFARAIGIDISEEVLALAQQEVDAQRRDNVQLLPCDGTTIPVDDASVRLVYSFLVMIHIPDKSVVINYLREAYRVLQPGGILRFQVRKSPSRFASRDNAHVGGDDYELSKGCTFTPRELDKAARQVGFNVLSTGGDTRRPYNNIPSETQLWVTARKEG